MSALTLSQFNTRDQNTTTLDLGRHLNKNHRHKRKRYIMLALHKDDAKPAERHAAAPVRAVRLALSEPELSRLSHQGEALLKSVFQR
jgi:chorismate-pyruvate lyase